MKKLLLASTLLLFTACTSGSPTNSNSDTSPARVGNGKTRVFHTTTCRYVVAGLTDPVNFTTRADAIAAGYTPDQSGACTP